MSILSDFIDKVKEKKAELDERREFVAMVEDKAKPIRRLAYMEQMLKESVNEGIAKAKLDSQKKIPKEKKTSPEDFGLKPDTIDWGYLDNIGKDIKDSQLTKSKKKKK